MYRGTNSSGGSVHCGNADCRAAEEEFRAKYGISFDLKDAVSALSICGGDLGEDVGRVLEYLADLKW